MIKKILLFVMVALPVCITAQNRDDVASGFNGMTRTVPNSVSLPYALEVAYDKTVHIIFPSPVSYVDLGSTVIMAGKAPQTENVLRVKASIDGFDNETNLGVICKDGAFYSFNVKFSKEPKKLNIEMSDMFAGANSNLPVNKSDIYFSELGDSSPVLVQLIMKTIYGNDNRFIKHIGTRMYGLEYTLCGIYTYNNMLYLDTRVKNRNDIPYNVDFVKFKIIDKEKSKRTAMQENVITPLRSYNNLGVIESQKTENTVWAFDLFTLHQDKLLEVTMYEKKGGRILSFTVDSEALLMAKKINNLKLSF